MAITPIANSEIGSSARAKLNLLIAPYETTATEASAAVNVTDAGYPPCNVKRYGAKGDGVTNDTVAIRAAFASVPSIGGTVYFPAGTYIITRLLAPSQPPSFSSAIFWLKPYTRMEGAGPDQTIIKMSFPYHGDGPYSNNPTPTFYFCHQGGFSAEGIQFLGDNQADFAFNGLTNDNVVIAHYSSPSGTTETYERIHRCRFNYIPGCPFVCDIPMRKIVITENQFLYCGGSLNPNGNEVLVADNQFEWSWGIEIGPQSAAGLDSGGCGRIHIVNNTFYETLVGIAVGGNFSDDERSYGYIVANNTLRNQNYTSTGSGIAVAQNAWNSSVVGNNISGLFLYGILSSTYDATRTAGNLLISSNYIDISANTSFNCVGVYISHQSTATSEIIGNSIRVNNDCPPIQIVNTVNCLVTVAGNYLQGEIALKLSEDFTKVAWHPNNIFYTTDASNAADFVQPAAKYTATNWLPPIGSRMSLADATQGGARLATYYRVAGDGGANYFGGGLYAQYYNGKMEWGTTGVVDRDTNLYRAAADQLKTDDKFICAVGLGVGNATTASSTVGTLARKVQIFDISGSAIGYVPVYATIT